MNANEGRVAVMVTLLTLAATVVCLVALVWKWT